MVSRASPKFFCSIATAAKERRASGCFGFIASTWRKAAAAASRSPNFQDATPRFKQRLRPIFALLQSRPRNYPPLPAYSPRCQSQIAQAERRVLPLRLHRQQSLQQFLRFLGIAVPLRRQRQIPQRARQVRRNFQRLLDTPHARLSDRPVLAAPLPDCALASADSRPQTQRLTIGVRGLLQASRSSDTPRPD